MSFPEAPTTLKSVLEADQSAVFMGRVCQLKFGPLLQVKAWLLHWATCGQRCLNSDDMGRPLWMQTFGWLPPRHGLTSRGQSTTLCRWGLDPASWEYLKLHKMQY